MGPPQQGTDAFAGLRRFLRKRPNVERCDLCGQQLPSTHDHLMELSTRKLVCACTACALLFSNQSTKKYRRVPRQIRFLADFRMTDAEWDSLLIPINMAFFFHSSAENRVSAVYPSPAGPTESLLSLQTWHEIAQRNPTLSSLEEDVEALLVNRTGLARSKSDAEYYILPIDECFKLTGLIRAHWTGFSGGTEVWQQIERFFHDLRKRAVLVTMELGGA